MNIAVLQHLQIEGPGLLGDIIAGRGHALRVHRLWQQLPDIEELLAADGWLIMGGPASAHDETPVIRFCLDAIGEGLRLGKPMLGICLGAQMLAKAAGGEIRPSPVRELGWYPVFPTPHAQEDPLFAPLPAQGLNIFQWHGETFTLPDAATLLATHPRVPHQAFRLGPGQYGLQFHVEVDADMIETWIRAGSSERQFLGQAGLKQTRLQIASLLPAMHRFCDHLTMAWLQQAHEISRG